MVCDDLLWSLPVREKSVRNAYQALTKAAPVASSKPPSKADEITGNLLSRQRGFWKSQHGTLQMFRSGKSILTSVFNLPVMFSEPIQKIARVHWTLEAQIILKSPTLSHIVLLCHLTSLLAVKVRVSKSNLKNKDSSSNHPEDWQRKTDTQFGWQKNPPRLLPVLQWAHYEAPKRAPQTHDQAQAVWFERLWGMHVCVCVLRVFLRCFLSRFQKEFSKGSKHDQPQTGHSAAFSKQDVSQLLTKLWKLTNQPWKRQWSRCCRNPFGIVSLPLSFLFFPDPQKLTIWEYIWLMTWSDEQWDSDLGSHTAPNDPPAARSRPSGAQDKAEEPKASTPKKLMEEPG